MKKLKLVFTSTDFASYTKSTMNYNKKNEYS